MINLKKVCKQFDTAKIIKNLDLEIEKGEVVGFLGPNGAGKTTTIRMIAGVLPPTSGEILINNINLFDPELDKKPHLGYLPENNPIDDEMTVEEFLQYWADLKKIPLDKQKQYIDDAVRSVGLKDVYYRLLSDLSKGYRQRAGLAQAILSKPDILLLDEPTEGLDPNQRREIHKLIRGLGKQRTVIISSHVLPEITKMCDRVLIINRGKIVGDSSTKHLEKLSGGEVVYELLAKGTKIEVNLKKIKGVLSVAKEKDPSGTRYIISADSNKDLRTSIFKLAQEKKWELSELLKKQENLEDIFVSLTK